MDSVEKAKAIFQNVGEVETGFRMVHKFIFESFKLESQDFDDSYKKSQETMKTLLALFEAYHAYRSSGEMECPVGFNGSKEEVAKNIRQVIRGLYKSLGVDEVDKESGDYDDKRFK